MEKDTLTPEEARKIYMKNWRKNNKERVKKYQETYWQKKAKEMEAQACQK